MADRGRPPHASGPPSGRAPSQASAVRSPDASRVASPARSAAGQPGWTQGPGVDPARLGGPVRKAGNTRMELPPDAYVSDTQKSMFTLRGNNLNTEGSPAVVEVNQYRMTKFDFSKKIYQYDVSTPASCLPRNILTLTRSPCLRTPTRRLLFSRKFGSTQLSRLPCRNTTTRCGSVMATSLPGLLL